MQSIVTFIYKLFSIVIVGNYFHTIFDVKLENNNPFLQKNCVSGVQTELQRAKFPRSYERLKNISVCGICLVSCYFELLKVSFET